MTDQTLYIIEAVSVARPRLSPESAAQMRAPQRSPGAQPPRASWAEILALLPPETPLLPAGYEGGPTSLAAVIMVTDTDYYTRTTRTIANKSFASSGKLEVKLSKKWEDQTILAIRDECGAPIEDQLSTLIRTLEIAEAEAEWSRKEERRAEIRTIRWEEVKQEALIKVAYDRNVAQLDEQLHRRHAAAAMRMYADQIESRTENVDEPARMEAIEWAAWIRQHADRTDPLRLLQPTSASRDELEPHMNGWTMYGPYRR